MHLKNSFLATVILACSLSVSAQDNIEGNETPVLEEIIVTAVLNNEI